MKMAGEEKSARTNVYLLLDGEPPASLAGSLRHLGPLGGPAPRPAPETEPDFPQTYGPVPQASGQNPSGFFLDRYVY